MCLHYKEQAAFSFMVAMCSVRHDRLAYGGHVEIYEDENNSFQGHDVFFLSEGENRIL
jgi:hypothetical protein